MELRDVTTVVCLLLGTSLVVMQFMLSFREAGQKKQAAQQVVVAAEKVKGAAERVKVAADQMSSTSIAVRSRMAAPGMAALAQDDLVHYRTQLDDDSKAVGAAAERAKAEAQEGAEEAEEGAKGANQFDVVNTLAGKLPLAVMGLLFIALGSFLQGWIAVSAAAGAGN